MQKTAYILGAGASAPYGIPTFNTFKGDVGSIWEQVPPLHHLWIIWDRMYDGMNFEELYSYLQVQDSIDLEPDITEVGSVTAADTEELNTGPFVDDDRLQIRNAMSGLLRAIPHTIYGAGDLQVSDVYDLLASEIGAQRRDLGFKAVEVLSFNWDTLLQISLIEERLQPRLPEVGAPTGTDWVNVTKPHGSLNLEHCDSCGLQRRLPESDRYGDPLWSPADCPRGHGKMNPIVLAPHVSKDPPPGVQTWYSQTWRQTWKTLRRCSRLVIIGYSFPLTDYQVSLTLRSALNVNRRLQEITVVTNPKESAEEERRFEEHYEEVFKPSGHKDKLSFKYDGIQGYV